MNRKIAFSLVELLVVVTVIGVLGAVAVPAYNNYVEKARNSELITEGLSFGEKISQYYNYHGRFPDMGGMWADATTPTAAGGCYQVGTDTCKYYYYRHASGTRAYMHVRDSAASKAIYLVFQLENEVVKAYCGPWEVGNATYIQADNLPGSCTQELVTLWNS